MTRTWPPVGPGRQAARNRERKPNAVSGRAVRLLPKPAGLAGSIVTLGAVWARMMARSKVLIRAAVRARRSMTRQAPDLVAVPLGLRVGFMLLQARDPVLPKDAAHQLWAEGPPFRILRSFGRSRRPRLREHSCGERPTAA